MNDIKIAPSVLSADFSRIREEIDKLIEAGVEIIHLDVMDGHFVPNITFGPKFIKDIRKYTGARVAFDIHLMIENPDSYLKDFADAISNPLDGDTITVHLESTVHIGRTVDKIRSLGKRAGISLVPTTNESTLEYLLDEVDLVLAMTVSPGYGGQEFINSQLRKIRNIREMIDASGRKIDLEVDGGINRHSARLARDAGANVLVAGSYIFSGPSYRERINDLRSN
ncbi:MAG: ribulose-phosphate 3-epimerase [Rickettsiales bacterium]|jgi:ribulose-phosphate 3-epimerase|nr:ribulose-phosphate 3-epimerase [Rickettsiales bacterium]